MIFVFICWAFLFGPAVFHSYIVHSSAAHYQLKDFIVTGSKRIGGQDRNTAKHIFLTGTIDGVEEEINADRVTMEDYPPGTVIKVWYNPNIDAMSINHENFRVRRLADSLKLFSKHAFVRHTALLVITLVLTIILNIIYRVRAPRLLNMKGGLPYLGIPILAFAFSFMIMQAIHYSLGQIEFISWELVAGPLLLIPGAAMSINKTIRMEPGLNMLLSSWRLFGIRLFEKPLELEKKRKVRLIRKNKGDAGIFYELKIQHGNKTKNLGEFENYEMAHKGGKALSDFLRCHFVNDGPFTPPKRKTRFKSLTMGKVLFVIILSVIVGLSMMPDMREQILITTLEDIDVYPVRSAVAKLLAYHPSDKTIKVLVHFINSFYIKERDAVPKEEILASLEKIAGMDFGSYDNWFEATDKINRWASKRLNLPLDGNGGVHRWYDIDYRLIEKVNEMGSKDPHSGWSAWRHFAAGTATSEGTFLLLAGAGLADKRPIYFAIKKGPFWKESNASPAFEGQPEPIENYTDEVIAHTVGEAIALAFWRYSIEAEKFPEEFKRWYEEYARKRRLPPMHRLD